MAKGKLSKDQERLAKLWDAYEIQERELELSLKKISTLEKNVELIWILHVEHVLSLIF